MFLKEDIRTGEGAITTDRDKAVDASDLKRS